MSLGNTMSTTDMTITDGDHSGDWNYRDGLVSITGGLR